ncbi:MAG: crotonase/enoyl-CoA hydratase family protein [Gemmatimonadales bacterium]|nr:MAG: crotonase/enoyl-CoA hydratase family protein [Gemmatimonadales bacterium]
MNKIVSYRVEENLATLTIDDGKANAVSLQFVEEVNAALDQAEQDKAVTILTGRPGKFSAGFDLSALSKGGEAATQLVRTGALLCARSLGFPTPVIIACNGHSLALGALLLLSADYRVGTEGNYKIGTNEVAIGMPLPYFGVELARLRLSPIHFSRAVANAEIYTPQGAVEAGFLDVVVSEERLMETAMQSARGLAKLDMAAHYATKLRVREKALSTIHEAIEKEYGV